LKDNRIILGTRGSELALCQTDMVTAALQAAHPGLTIERKIITTSGDKRQDLRFSEFAASAQVDKGIFVKELELALASGDIDAAVHSLKDVPSDIPGTFCIAATLPRAPIEDVLVSVEGHKVKTLSAFLRVGTSSVRRAKQLVWLKPSAQPVEIRGNVPTRLKKLLDPAQDLQAIMLARAGLERLGLLKGNEILIDGVKLYADILPVDYFLPAAGQGAVAIETRAKDNATRALLQDINDVNTLTSVQAEREFLRLLGAGCQTPVGAHTWIEGDMLHMKVLVFDEQKPNAAPKEAQASAWIRQPLALASALAKQILNH
jgi:hydroxymethylbilane synthase